MRIEGQIAYVDDDGFETPVLLKEVVVVMPAGHDRKDDGPRLMFDQKAFDDGRKKPEPKAVAVEPEPVVTVQSELPVEETAHGDKMNIALAFEPSDVKHLDKSRFSAVLVNDSNYFLNFTLLRRSEEERGWTMVWQGTVAPNEYCDMVSLTHETLPQYEKIAFQCVAYKKDKLFTLQAPVSVSRKLDLTKFHKYHCFRPGIYFETPVLEIPIVTDGVAHRPLEVNAAEVASAMQGDRKDKDAARELSKKYKVDSGRKGKMLEMQLAAVRKHMRANSGRIGQKLVFIHGKGEGVLRKAVLDLLKKEWPKAELQDASFREYGFGATLVTIH